MKAPLFRQKQPLKDLDKRRRRYFSVSFFYAIKSAPLKTEIQSKIHKKVAEH